jgi:predicted nucleic acid-binding Zn ribbon protein
MQDEKTIKELIGSLLTTYGLQGKVSELKLISQWEQMVGSVIAKRTKSILVKGKTLHLWIESAPLKQELLYHKPVIIEKVNAAMGPSYIDEIVIR